MDSSQWQDGFKSSNWVNITIQMYQKFADSGALLLAEHPVDQQQKIALYIQAVLYSLLAILSFFG